MPLDFVKIFTMFDIPRTVSLEKRARAQTLEVGGLFNIRGKIAPN